MFQLSLGKSWPRKSADFWKIWNMDWNNAKNLSDFRENGSFLMQFPNYRR